MKQEIIVAIVGMPGAGKSEASQYFKDQQIPVLRFGDQTDIGLHECNLPRNEKNERWYREKLRSELGMAAMAIKIEPRIKEALKLHKLVVLDGLYSWEEYIYLKKKFSDLKLLCIYASPRIRYQRLSQRPIRPLTTHEAKTRDYAELENLNKGGPIAIADYLIVNETSKKYLIQQLELSYKFLYE